MRDEGRRGSRRGGDGARFRRRRSRRRCTGGEGRRRRRRRSRRSACERRRETRAGIVRCRQRVPHANLRRALARLRRRYGSWSSWDSRRRRRRTRFPDCRRCGAGASPRAGVRGARRSQSRRRPRRPARRGPRRRTRRSRLVRFLAKLVEGDVPSHDHGSVSAGFGDVQPRPRARQTAAPGTATDVAPPARAHREHPVVRTSATNDDARRAVADHAAHQRVQKTLGASTYADSSAAAAAADTREHRLHRRLRLGA